MSTLRSQCQTLRFDIVFSYRQQLYADCTYLISSVLNNRAIELISSKKKKQLLVNPTLLTVVKGGENNNKSWE